MTLCKQNKTKKKTVSLDFNKKRYSETLNEDLLWLLFSDKKDNLNGNAC